MESCYLKHALSQMSYHLERLTQVPQYYNSHFLESFSKSLQQSFIHYRDIFEKIQLIELTLFTNLYTVWSSITLIQKFLAWNI